MDWHDFNIGTIINTPDGRGVVEGVSRLKKQVEVTLIETGEAKNYKITEIYSSMGQLKLSFCTQIGQFILLFQRLENRLKDFMNYALDLNSNQRKELTSDFTTGKLKSKIDSIFKKYSQQEHKETWKQIGSRMEKLKDVRNTIIHGYLFHYNENYELDYNSLYIENSNGKSEILNRKKTEELTAECQRVYYETHQLFSLTYELIKNEMKKSR